MLELGGAPYRYCRCRGINDEWCEARATARDVHQLVHPSNRLLMPVARLNAVSPFERLLPSQSSRAADTWPPVAGAHAATLGTSPLLKHSHLSLTTLR